MEHSKGIEEWLKLSGADEVGAITFKHLLKRFGSVDRALGASVSELMRIPGIGSRKAERIARSRNKLDVRSELQLAEKLGVTIINIADKRYPVLLKRINDPPAVLYIKGTLERTDAIGVAIVGSRKCSMYGRQQASRLGYLLSSAGLTIYSGMARGIDSAAHQGVLSAGRRTIAVQGCGLANIFPPENKRLFENIAKSGACISELPLKYEPLAENFPPRNRIIAGMTLATIVIEAGLRSGAMITSKLAGEYDREVMAVPGKIDSPLSKGPHRLIKDGAVLVESAEDALDAIGYASRQLKRIAGQEFSALEINQAQAQKPKVLELKGREKKIYEGLTTEPVYIDDVISKVKLPAGQVNAGLVQLQMKGLVEHKSGNHFCRKQPLS